MQFLRKIDVLNCPLRPVHLPFANVEFEGEMLEIVSGQERIDGLNLVFDPHLSLPLLVAGEDVSSELKNVCVWNKNNGGMGSFYRSKHEVVFVFKVGTAPHLNTFGLGDTGRYRTNVWNYAGVNTLRAGRAEELAMHPTVKPVALVADAMKDCSRRGDIVLDPFAGSGTTLIVAEKAGRRAATTRRRLDPFFSSAKFGTLFRNDAHRIRLVQSLRKLGL